MTRDELIENVSYAIDTLWNGEIDEKEAAINILNTIFTALQEPTDAMKRAAWVNSKSYHNRDIWQAMLAASPLAPEK